MFSCKCIFRSLLRRFGNDLLGDLNDTKDTQCSFTSHLSMAFSPISDRALEHGTR